jgi:GGDEF domain-containing protein
MAVHSAPKLLWGLGLNDIERQRIVAGAGMDYILRDWPVAILPAAGDVERDRPFLVFIPSRVWTALPQELHSTILDMEPLQKVLLIEPNHPVLDYAALLARDFLSLLPCPLTEEKVCGVLTRAAEAAAIYEDILRMTREIALEREILAFKSDALVFLNRTLSRAVESLNPATILAQAREDLNMLLPVAAVQGAFWNAPGGGAAEAEIFLCFQEQAADQDQWVEFLLKSAGKLSGSSMHGYQLTFLMDGAAEGAGDLSPQPGRVVLLPLKAGGQTFGCLALLLAGEARLGKDQREVLRSAVNHLALALKNALLYREVKTRADHDGLTRIHNRQSFDERLVDELARHQRYGHDLSLLLMDLDHFKCINDTHGHQAGDLVLKEVGGLLNETLRSTDFAARYGGEEFAVILPTPTRRTPGTWPIACATGSPASASPRPG